MDLLYFGSLNAGTFKNDSSTGNTPNAKITAQAKEKLPLNADELFIAKTLYSQTSTLCSWEQINAIACIIQNRINLKDFGNCKSAIEVCKHPGTFSSVSKHNVNWDQYDAFLNKYANYDAKVAKILASDKFKLVGAPWMNDIVYYHDKSISKPKSWDNKYYKTILVKETAKFKFYKVQKVKPKTMLAAKNRKTKKKA